MTLSNRGRLWLLIGGVVFIAAAAALAIFSRSDHMGSGPRSGAMAWYTADDGKTWFADTRGKLTPFDHHGDPTYRCYVYSCNDGKTMFVGYLERFTPESTQQLQAIMTAKTPPPPDVIEQLSTAGVEIALPNTQDWIKATDRRAASVRNPKCPDGSQQRPIEIFPSE